VAHTMHQSDISHILLLLPPQVYRRTLR